MDFNSSQYTCWHYIGGPLYHWKLPQPQPYSCNKSLAYILSDLPSFPGSLWVRVAIYIGLLAAVPLHWVPWWPFEGFPELLFFHLQVWYLGPTGDSSSIRLSGHCRPGPLIAQSLKTCPVLNQLRLEREEEKKCPITLHLLLFFLLDDLSVKILIDLKDAYLKNISDPKTGYSSRMSGTT